MATTDVCLKNELIVFVSDVDWIPQLQRSLLDSKTNQISVDDVIVSTTPFGAHALYVHMTVTRPRATTYDLKDYLCRVLVRNGLDIEMSDIITPSRAKRFRVQ